MSSPQSTLSISTTLQPPQNHVDEQSDSDPARFLKVPKRKRLAKACDACHKSKRRCDGTAPCSNCYFASKTCTYTDASGRSVPAPRPFKLESPTEAPPPNHARHSIDGLSPSQSMSLSLLLSTPSPARPEDDGFISRKRVRSQRDFPITFSLSPIKDRRPSSGFPAERIPIFEPSLMRELVNLFFTHCHPQSIIIHKPSFQYALGHNHIPLHLLYAICALAAPLSKQPKLRTNPPHMAGRHFAQEAAYMMFDDTGRLTCEHSLATAQALCLLQMHEWVSQRSRSARYHELALQIVENLGVHKTDEPAVPPFPPSESIDASIQRECARRIMWLVYVVDLMSYVYFKQTPGNNRQPPSCLPVDETSFELAVHSLPEYLHLTSPRSQSASEFGHLIRIVTIYSKVEPILDLFNESTVLSDNSLIQLGQDLERWENSLPPHLVYSEENLQIQLSMFETSSNAGAWCFCCMHVMHISCGLALNIARQRGEKGSLADIQGALSKLEKIVASLDDRARNSIILGAALWALHKYCKKDDAQTRTWSGHFEELWGIRVQDLVSTTDWRQRPESQAPAHFSLSTPQEQPQPRLVLPPATPMPIPISPSSFPSLGRSLDELRLHTRSGPPHDGTLRRADEEWDGRITHGGPHSLPSLKASGLLDSWNGPEGATGKRRPSPPTLSLPRPVPLLESPPLLGMARNGSASTNGGLPVGLQWLANE